MASSLALSGGKNRVSASLEPPASSLHAAKSFVRRNHCVPVAGGVQSGQESEIGNPRLEQEGDYAGNYAGNYAGDYAGDYAGNYAANYAPNYAQVRHLWSHYVRVDPGVGAAARQPSGH